MLTAWFPLRCLLLAPLLLTATSSWAAAVTIPDPKGDDFGAGGVLYPNRPDMKPGDLDLTELSFESRPDGTWFAVRFAQPVRGPGSEVTATGQVPVANIARLGFYTFNVDIYVDTDRVAGSGFTDSLPGRGVAIDRAFAWERAIVLTPRPDVARRYWFPTRVRVMGREVQFYVPASFLGRSADARMGYTAIVTGAELDQVGRSFSGGRNRAVMMVMPLVRGLRDNAFGLRSDDDAASPPVIDVLAPTIDAQRSALQNFDIVAGRLATMPGIAPDGSVAAAPPAGVASTAADDKVAQHDGAPRVGDAARPSAPSTGGRRTMPERLRELNQLRADGLISEQEYLDLRRKILSEL